MGMHGKTNTSHSNLPYGVSLYTIIRAHAVSMCTLRLPRHMQGSWTCQRPVVRLAVRMSSVTEHFIDHPTLNDTIQCLFICPFHDDIVSFILRKRMGEVIKHTVIDTSTTHTQHNQINPIPSHASHNHTHTHNNV